MSIDYSLFLNNPSIPRKNYSKKMKKKMERNGMMTRLRKRLRKTILGRPSIYWICKGFSLKGGRGWVHLRWFGVGFFYEGLDKEELWGE